MPTPLIPQPMMMASGPAPFAMFCGRLNTPDPIIDPMTTAVSAPSTEFSRRDRRCVSVAIVDNRGGHGFVLSDLVQWEPSDAARNFPP